MGNNAAIIEPFSITWLMRQNYDCSALIYTNFTIIAFNMQT